MGHLAGKDVYRKLGRKIDGLTVRVPWNETLHSILHALYSTEEADLVVRMPFGLATTGQIEKTTRLQRADERQPPVKIPGGGTARCVDATAPHRLIPRTGRGLTRREDEIH